MSVVTDLNQCETKNTVVYRFHLCIILIIIFLYFETIIKN